MKLTCQIFLLCIICTFSYVRSNAQLRVVSENSGQALVQKLLGSGVTVSNVRLTSDRFATGIFKNISGTNISLDSGIVLTNGRAKSIGTGPGEWGVDGDGATLAYPPPNEAFANYEQYDPFTIYSGDADLARQIGLDSTDTHDACILEFDFVPLGDSIKFRYVFSSEEYPEYSCPGPTGNNFNDAFAFFIQGPGIAGKKNIALIPGSADPVTINNINDQACALYPQYYVNNYASVAFTHNAHTKVFTALAQVQPCQTYHLKLVIADVADGSLDSGVFLEAGSLSSNAISIENITQVDPANNYYLVEGCSLGAFKVKRPNAETGPLNVSLTYAGTAINGVDMQLLPTTVTIPANQSEVIVNVVPIIDNIPEGIEFIKIYALAGGCASNTPTDSTVIQIRDYDTLGIAPDTAYICKNTAVQLIATSGYTTYQWDTDATLNSLSIRTPVATPVNERTTYYCTSRLGTCHGRDSAFVQWKKLDLVSKTEINCKDAATGEIVVDGGIVWTGPVEYALNNGPWQTGNIFSNLPVGVYTVKIKDATGCMDSLTIPVTQIYPDLLVSNTVIQAASCSGNADGSVSIVATGGKAPYQYSIGGVNFQPGNTFNLVSGNHTIIIKDDNNCTASQLIFIPLNNTVTLDAGADKTICEGKNTQLNAVSNANTFNWLPAATLDNSALQNPIATPVVTTRYFVTASTGICNQQDSVTVIVNPAPIPNAGSDSTICFGRNIQLSGSGGISYFWSPSSSLNNNRIQNPTTINLPGSITYALHVTDAHGCNSLQKDEVVISVTRQAIVEAGRDTVLALGQFLTLQALDINHVGFNQFEWTPYNGLNNPFTQTVIASPDRDMLYTITARTPIGCVATDKIKILVYKGPEIYVPNAFTPNNDGTNDILKAIPVGIRDFRYFRIYDRWGNLVFATTNPAYGWDGRIKGAIQSTATYVWMAEGIDFTGKTVQRKGSVVIIK